MGKTALLRHFCDGRDDVLWGDCDALFTPSQLGPLTDIAEVTGGDLAAAVADAAPAHVVTAAFLRELEQRGSAIVVVEDVHWADEATLDVLRLLGRRIATVPVLLIATYRDDELDRSHPLRVMLGELSRRDTTSRLRLVPLSLEAVAELAEPFGVDRRRAPPPDGGQPVLRDRGARGRRRRAARHGPRRGARARQAAQPGGAARARRGGDRARPGRAGAARDAGRRRDRRSSRNASRAACSGRRPPASPSGTTSRTWRSRRRCCRTSGSSCTAARWTRSAAAPIPRGSPTTPRGRATARRCCATRRRRPSARRPRAPTARRRRSTPARCGSPAISSPPSARGCWSAARTSATRPTCPARPPPISSAR